MFSDLNVSVWGKRQGITAVLLFLEVVDIFLEGIIAVVVVNISKPGLTIPSEVMTYAMYSSHQSETALNLSAELKKEY